MPSSLESRMIMGALWQSWWKRTSVCKRGSVDLCRARGLRYRLEWNEERFMATAEIVAIGSELLLGQIVDTNSAWKAQRLTARGVKPYFKSVGGANPGR